MSSISKNIEKQLISSLKKELKEIDIDGMVHQFIKNNKVKNIVNEFIRSKIAQEIQESVLLKIKRLRPNIDIYSDNRVRELFNSFNLSNKKI